MSNQYRNNHYVPQWYQKRFLPVSQEDKELYYLDLKPNIFIDSKGKSHQAKAVHRQGFRKCFVEKDLYTTTFKSVEPTIIEQRFFGEIDRNGRNAVDYFTNFTHPSIGKDEFKHMVTYMSTQKLRTPKGLDWLSNQVNSNDQNQILAFMLRFQTLHCAIWTVCIWLIADASRSDTKFIISDHPVTVYNRRCGPRSQWCRGSNDPDIRFHGTHTIFPLSLNKILILTNLSWVRNPYQSETKLRPNPNLFRGAIFNFMDIQTLRYLSEQEVREINFIIKSRAFRYIAAAKEEWLYPERHISKSQWNVYGNGYLLMPDPRSTSFGGEIIFGNYDGTATSFDEYGYRPWQADYAKKSRSKEEFRSFLRFQGEFARLYGPERRGRAFQFGKLDNERDTDKFHQYHLSLERKKGKLASP